MKILAIDAALFCANMMKIPHGGWVPLGVGLAIYTVFSTFKRGREILGTRMREQSIPLERFLKDLATAEVVRRSPRPRAFAHPTLCIRRDYMQRLHVTTPSAAAGT